MSQTSYSVYHEKGYEGSRGDSRAIQCFTGRNVSGAELPYGRAIVSDSGASDVDRSIPGKVISATGQIVQGFSLSDLAHENQTTGVPINGVFNILREGCIWVLPEQDVLPSDPVFVRHTLASGTGTDIAVGKVRKDADTAKADALLGARFMTKALAGTPCQLWLNLP